MKKTPNARRNLLVSVEKVRDLSQVELAKVAGGKCKDASCDLSDLPPTSRTH